MKRLLAGIAALAAVAIAPGTAQADGHVEITLLHGIPGVDVDVAVSGTVVVPDFAPGETFDLTPFAGTTLNNVEARLAGTEDVVIELAEFAVPAEGSWTVLAHLDADGSPTVTPFENDTSAPAAEGQGRLTVRHAAAAPAVDVVLGAARPVADVANGDERAIDLPAAELAGAQIAPTGGDPIADVPTVAITAGKNLIVYAVGSLDEGTFDFYTQEVDLEVEGDGTPAPTAVDTGEPISDAVNASVLAAAAGMLVLAGGAFALRRRTVQD